MLLSSSSDLAASVVGRATYVFCQISKRPVTIPQASNQFEEPEPMPRSREARSWIVRGYRKQWQSFTSLFTLSPSLFSPPNRVISATDSNSQHSRQVLVLSASRRSVARNRSWPSSFHLPPRTAFRASSGDGRFEVCAFAPVSRSISLKRRSGDGELLGKVKSRISPDGTADLPTSAPVFAATGMGCQPAPVRDPRRLCAAHSHHKVYYCGGSIAVRAEHAVKIEQRYEPSGESLSPRDK